MYYTPLYQLLMEYSIGRREDQMKIANCVNGRHQC